MRQKFYILMLVAFVLAGIAIWGFGSTGWAIAFCVVATIFFIIGLKSLEWEDEADDEDEEEAKEDSEWVDQSQNEL